MSHFGVPHTVNHAASGALRRNGKAAMSRIDRSKSRSAGGYTTQYSCLQAEPPVTEGQQVAAGDIIGLVGSTAAAESSMGPHLHFSVAKDGVIIDPSEYIG